MEKALKTDYVTAVARLRNPVDCRGSQTKDRARPGSVCTTAPHQKSGLQRPGGTWSHAGPLP